MLTPLSIIESFYLNDDSPLIDAKLFWHVVGTLQYISLICLDVCFTINKLSQFMHRPIKQQWHAMKCVLRCLNGSISHGFFLHCQTPLTLHAFSNVNWVRDFDTHFSTSTYVAFLGANFISWSFKEQPTVAHSFTEAEYHVIIFAVVEIN